MFAYRRSESETSLPGIADLTSCEVHSSTYCSCHHHRGPLQTINYLTVATTTDPLEYCWPRSWAGPDRRVLRKSIPTNTLPPLRLTIGLHSLVARGCRVLTFKHDAAFAHRLKPAVGITLPYSGTFLLPSEQCFVDRRPLACGRVVGHCLPILGGEA